MIAEDSKVGKFNPESRCQSRRRTKRALPQKKLERGQVLALGFRAAWQVRWAHHRTGEAMTKDAFMRSVSLPRFSESPTACPKISTTSSRLRPCEPTSASMGQCLLGALRAIDERGVQSPRVRDGRPRELRVVLVSAPHSNRLLSPKAASILRALSPKQW